ncbi:MAG: hypothetical protein Fur0016_17780 [Anaerolineales bacterium]
MGNFPARLFIPLLIALLGLPLFTPTALAQTESPITLTARAGFDGYCKENRWIPARVTVENTGKDVQARVQVSYPNRSNGQTAFGLDLPLPSGARKEFFLYTYPESYLQKLTVSVTENGRTLIKRDLNITCLSEKNLLVGLLSDTPSNYTNLGDLKPLDGVTRVVQLRQADLPDQAQGWQALNALLIANADTGQLTSAQRTALRVWLAEGGKLLVTGGANWQMTAAGLAELLPLTPESTRRVETLAELPSYFHATSPLTGGATLSTGALHKDAQVLVEQDGIPLLTRRAIGFGEVYYLATDPGLAPLKDWSGMEAIYSHLLGAQIAPPRWAKWPWQEEATGNALATLPELGLPSFLLVCGWLGFYLVIIGPVNFIVLRRIKRPELAWLTIPTLVVVFTTFAYFSGFLYRGTRPTLNRLLVAQGWETVPLARVNAVVGIYSPTRTRYDLESVPPFRFLPQGNDGASLQTGGNWLSLEMGDGQILPDARLEIGGMKSVALEGSLPALQITHDLTVTVSSRTPQLEGQVTNLSSVTLKDAFLVTPGSITNLNDLKPGESRPIRIPLQVDRNNPGFYQMDSTALPGYYGPLTGIENETNQRRNALLRAAVKPQEYYSIPANWGIYLMGWVESPLLPVSVRQVNTKNVDTALVIQMLAPAFQFEGDSWRLNSALFAWESSQPEATPYSTSYGLANQGYLLRFRPAAPLRFSRVKSLTVTLDGGSMPQKTTLEMWNYDLGLWSQVEFADWGQIRISEPGRFVGPGGEVLLKLQSDPNDWSEIYQSSIDLVVQP